MNKVEERLLHPAPGSHIEAAREHGVDLTLLIERLRRTPEERVRDLQQALRGLEAVRGRAHRTFKPQSKSAPLRKRA